MPGLIRRLAREALARAGVEVRANPYSDPYALIGSRVAAERPTVVDVGAFTGETYARFRALFPSADIHLVEPFPASAEALRSRTASDARCTVHELALSSAAGTATLHANLSPATNSLRPLADTAATTWEADHLRHEGDVAIVTSTLDALCAAAGIGRIDVLKMDVQGAEHDVLTGAAETLAAQRVGLILFEHIFADTYAGQRPLADYLSLLDAHGYALLDILEPVRRRGPPVAVRLPVRRPSSSRALTGTAGWPVATLQGGTSRVAVERAVTIAPSPIATPGPTKTSAVTQASAPIVIGAATSGRARSRASWLAVHR